MKAVRDVSVLSGLSRRTLQYYDEIGLLKPAAIKPSGYRLYDDQCLERLWRILFYKELGFSLEEITKILETSPDIEKKLIEKHRHLLIEKQEKLAKIIKSAGSIIDGSFNDSMLKDFDMRPFEQTKKENQKITVRKLTVEDPYYDFLRPLIGYKLTSRKGVSSLIRNIRNSANTDWDAIRLKGEEIGPAFVFAMQYSPDSFQAMKAVETFKTYAASHLSSCGNDVLTEISELYLKDEEYVDKHHPGLARFVSENKRLKDENDMFI